MHSSQGTTAFPGSSNRFFWILGRRYLRHNLFEVAENLPESKRKSALGLLVRKWSPFAFTQFSAHWVANRASVYAWDEAAVTAAITAAGHDPARGTVWPETFFRAPPDLSIDSFRLAKMSDGCEGQVWKHGLLMATRWWPSLPPERDWMLFLRTAGVDLSQAVVAPPLPRESELLDTPWTTQSSSVTDIWGMVQNNQAAAIAATVVALPFLYFLTEAAALSVATFRAESAIAGMSAANQSVRTDRSGALTNLDSAESYLSLDPAPPQFELMSAAADLIRDQKIAISEWSYDNSNLDLVLQADHPLDEPFFIERFERDGHFHNVTGTLGNQERELHLKMQVNPRTESKAAEAKPAGSKAAGPKS